MEEKKNEQGIINPKGFQDILAEDSSLTKTFTLDELNNMTKQGIDDSSVEKVYKAYQKVRSHGRKNK